jgi:hypothetical protein
MLFHGIREYRKHPDGKGFCNDERGRNLATILITSSPTVFGVVAWIVELSIRSRWFRILPAPNALTSCLRVCLRSFAPDKSLSDAETTAKDVA